ncbi:t119 [Tupaiid betaherpesvirus 1]|uniref:T119 n=1 Tax=Tupaiid herpesvirus 1 (strain 1) TaxID=10397 RepID=Q91TI2_TUHV1|nr:t119 [Tupaiid betaherpesvirus 1]AAK57165.1 t119 [Tupaiid betaherpesvirus 1]
MAASPVRGLPVLFFLLFGPSASRAAPSARATTRAPIPQVTCPDGVARWNRTLSTACRITEFNHTHLAAIECHHRMIPNGHWERIFHMTTAQLNKSEFGQNRKCPLPPRGLAAFSLPLSARRPLNLSSRFGSRLSPPAVNVTYDGVRHQLNVSRQQPQFAVEDYRCQFIFTGQYVAIAFWTFYAYPSLSATYTEYRSTVRVNAIVSRNTSVLLELKVNGTRVPETQLSIWNTSPLVKQFYTYWIPRPTAPVILTFNMTDEADRTSFVKSYELTPTPSRPGLWILGGLLLTIGVVSVTLYGLYKYRQCGKTPYRRFFSEPA